jgi:hypothetical protein
MGLHRTGKGGDLQACMATLAVGFIVGQKKFFWQLFLNIVVVFFLAKWWSSASILML